MFIKINNIVYKLIRITPKLTDRFIVNAKGTY